MSGDFIGKERRVSNDARLASLERDLHHMMERLNRMDEDLRSIEAGEVDEAKQMKIFHETVIARFDKIEHELTRYRGFIGGVLFLAAAIGAFIASAKTWIWVKMGWVQ